MHVPVLLNEIKKHLAIAVGETVVDATAGGGGHTAMLSEAVGKSGTVIALDADADNLERTKEQIADTDAQTYFFHTNFQDIGKVLPEAGFQSIDAILFDLGLSTMQLEESGRGFSFQKDEPLSMTFSTDPADITAEVVVNEWDEENVADVLYGFGGERFSRRIAREIAQRREQKRIRTTQELVSIIESTVPKWYANRKVHPATKTFQALRMAVNDEFGALQRALADSFALLSSGGRSAVISYHSGEDRIVKHFFKDKKDAGAGNMITKKPIQPSREEIIQNPRARSAKLRIFQKQ